MNAQRLLVDRSSKDAVPFLTKMADNQASSMGRLHALWTLEGMGELKPELIEKALKDSAAGIRENAIKLAEIHLSQSPELVKALLPLQSDPNVKVRFQLLLTLGFINTNEAQEARNNLLFKDINDKWIQIAALTAPSSQAENLLKVVIEKYQSDNPSYASLVKRLTSMIGANGTGKQIDPLVQQGTELHGREPQKQAAILEGLASGIHIREKPLLLSQSDQNLIINSFFQTESELLRKACLAILKVNGISNEANKNNAVKKAVLVASDSKLSDEKRADAIDFISLGNAGAHLDLLEKLLVPQEQPSVQLATLRTLGDIHSTKVTDYLIKQWPLLTSEIRDEAVNVFMSTPQRRAILIKALEDGKILTSSISFNRSVSLMQLRDDNLRKRARALFTKNEQQAKEINKQYQAALELQGDTLRGKQVYLQNCAMCHAVRGKMGVAFGPDLGTIHNWKKEDIMANILDPSLSISAGYELWDVELKNGESLQGIISSETPSAITLKNNGKADQTINRQDIKSLRSLNISAMRSGLNKNISKQQMADLLAFLRKN
jgi:putative heme-binding domain-containing protein